MTIDETKQVVNDHMPDTVWDDEQAPVYVGRSEDNDISVVVIFFDAKVTRVAVLRYGGNSANCETPERTSPDYLRRWLPLACDLVRLDV